MTAMALKLRSCYRRVLRELPLQEAPATLLSAPSPLQSQIRSYISDASFAQKPITTHLAEMEQYIQYLRAQRVYISLLERYAIMYLYIDAWLMSRRYNPGVNMNDEERIRLSARRVGMNLPEEHKP